MIAGGHLQARNGALSTPAFFARVKKTDIKRPGWKVEGERDPGRTMLLRRFVHWACSALGLLSVILLATADAVQGQSVTLAAEPPRKSNGLTDVVQWDNYTLFLHDQRMFV